MDRNLKDKINEKINNEEMNISEYIRDLVNNDLTNDDISKNQSYLYKTLNTIIDNILNERLNAITEIIKAIYLKQELIVFLLKTFDNDKFSEEIEEFTTSYQGDNLRTIL